MKTKTIYCCNACGAQFPKWMGQCNECNAWNSIAEEIVTHSRTKLEALSGFAGSVDSVVTPLATVAITEEQRYRSQFSEFDRVLGGGLVAGSCVLLGGDPGIGKSTLLLQVLTYFSQQHKTLYVSGEESLPQISLRARRLNVDLGGVAALAETNIERILLLIEREQAKIVVIDSIQTMYSENLVSAPGSLAQVRESAAKLVRFAKQHDIALFLVGHVTKEGVLAGPRVLEHMVDCVLYFESQEDQRYRLIRAVKNRFGAVNELGVFAMMEQGLREVSNPSAIFLARANKATPGSVVLAVWEGTRAMLLEVQALVVDSQLANPRRVALGIDQNRLAMLLAVLHRHGGIPIYNQDVYINVVGGVKITETAIDLAVIFAVVSSLRNKPLPQDLLVFGEVGLSGEIRPVPQGMARLQTAVKHGFHQVIVPQANVANHNNSLPEVTVHPVTSLTAALSIVL